MIRSLCVWGLVSLLLLTPSTAGAQTAPPLLDELLTRGDALYAQYQNAEALRVFREALEQASESFEVLTRLAQTAVDRGMDLEAEGNAEEASAHFQEAVGYADHLERLFPDSAKTYFHLIRSRGQLALFMGGREKVENGQHIETYCKKGLELAPDDPDLHVSYGIFQREVAELSWVERTLARTLFGRVPEGTKENAVQALRRAIELKPDFAFAHYELGVTYMGIGERALAAEAFQAALDLPATTTQDIRNRVVASRMLERLR